MLAGEPHPGRHFLKAEDFSALGGAYLEQVSDQVRQAGLYERQGQGLIVFLFREYGAARPAILALPRLSREPGKVPDVENQLL